MKAPFIAGNKVCLRGINKEELEKFVTWFNDPKVTHYMFTGARPVHLELLIEQWEREIRDQNEIVFAVLDKKEDKIIGSSGLYQLNWIARSAEYRVFIGERSSWGKGCGTETARLLVKYAFEKLNLNKVWLGVNTENKAAVKSYENADFVREGVLRQEIYRNNRYYDAIRMSVLKEEYNKRK